MNSLIALKYGRMNFYLKSYASEMWTMIIAAIEYMLHIPSLIQYPISCQIVQLHIGAKLLVDHETDPEYEHGY